MKKNHTHAYPCYNFHSFSLIWYIIAFTSAKDLSKYNFIAVLIITVLCVSVLTLSQSFWSHLKTLRLDDVWQMLHFIVVECKAVVQIYILRPVKKWVRQTELGGLSKLESPLLKENRLSKAKGQLLLKSVSLHLTLMDWSNHGESCWCMLKT